MSTVRTAIGSMLHLAVLMLSVVGGAAGPLQVQPVAAASDQASASAGRSPGQPFRRTEL